MLFSAFSAFSTLPTLPALFSFRRPLSLSTCERGNGELSRRSRVIDVLCQDMLTALHKH